MKSIILSFIYLFVLFQSGTSFAEQVDYKELERIINKMMTEFNVPGLAVGIVDKNKSIYMKGFGVRGVEGRQPVTPNTQFAIGSTSKAFTATALGMLVDQKVVDWDLPIKDNYLPDFELKDESATKLVTIRDLLTHRTGLPRHDLVWYGTPLEREEIYRRLKYLEPTAGIREKAQYQNMMYMTAGYLVGRVMDTTWEDYVGQNIFSALGMNNSNFSEIEMQKAADFAYPHASVIYKMKQIPFRNIDAVGPAGSINSSVRDMGKWLRLQLGGGQFEGRQIINRETLAEIHRPQMVSSISGFDKIFSELGTEHYSMGWFEQTYLNKKLVHHGGGIDGFVTFVGFLPEYDRGIVVFGNTGSLVPHFVAFTYLDLLLKGKAAPWSDRLKELMKKSELKIIKSMPLEQKIEAYFGTYTHPAYGEIVVSRTESPKVLLFTHYVIQLKLGHKFKNSFLPLQSNGKLTSDENRGVDPVTFLVDVSGKVTDLFFKADGAAPPIKFSKIQSELNIVPFTLDLTPSIIKVPKLGFLDARSQ